MTRKTFLMTGMAAAVAAVTPFLGQMAAASMEPAGAVSPLAATGGPLRLEPPRLDGTSLVDTQWQVTFKGMALTVSFLPGGALQVENPSLARLFHTTHVAGAWSAEGSELRVRADVLGKPYALMAVISGDEIIFEGRPAQRVQ